MNKKHFGIDIPWPNLSQAWAFARKWLLPNPGTLVLMVILALALPAIAGPSQAPSATSTSTISYQGRLADAAGDPLTGYFDIRFRIYDSPSAPEPLWVEEWDGENSVAVSDGLFNVMLGSINNTLVEPIAGHDELYLGIQVNQDSEMVPRVQLGSVPFSMQALTVADGSITTGKIATGAITTTHILDGAVADDKLANEKINKAGDSGVGSLHFPRYSRLYFNYDGTNEAQIGGDLGHGPRLYLNGNTQDVWIKPGLRVQGNLTVDGTKSSIVSSDQYGQRTLYAIESPEVRFADEGIAQLEDGVARVGLGPIFLETIEGEYLIHITPYGDASLYVAEVGKEYFVVRAREGDPEAIFAWRLSAHRKGYAGVRLEQIDELGSGVPEERR